MARIRTIKPEFWTSEQILDLSLPARIAGTKKPGQARYMRRPERGMIEIRPRPWLATLAGDLTCQPSTEVNMPMTNSKWSCALAHDVSLPQGFAVQCRFPGLPGKYLIASREHLAELSRDPVGFAADLAGLTRQQYLASLAPRANHG